MLRRLLLTSLLCGLCASVASPLRATTVTGTIMLPDGTPLNGTVEFVLSQPAQTLAPPALYVPEKVSCAITSGAITSCIVTGNDVLSPAGTYYSVTLLDANNRVVGPATNYTLSGASADLSALPVTEGATLVPPTGAVTGDLSVTGNLTVGGSATYGADPQTFAHLSFTGLATDPGTVGSGSLFYRSDLDRLRAHVGGLQLWDGSQYVDLGASAGTLSFSGDLKAGGTSSGVDNNVYIVDGTKYSTLAEAIAGKVAVSPSGGEVYLPANLGATSGAYALNGPVDLSALGMTSNWTLSGTGRYSSAMTLTVGANSSMLVAGAGDQVRTTINGLWFNGNKDNQTATHDCLVFGDQGQWWGMIFDRGGVASCKGDGMRLGSISYPTYASQGINTVMRSIFTDNADHGVEVVPPQTAFGSFRTIYQNSGGNGLYFHTTPDQPGVTDVMGEGGILFGDWFEGNARYGIRADGWQGLTVIAPRATNDEAFFFGRQTRNSSLENASFRANPVYDAGFYNKVADLACAQELNFTNLNAACANRSKFPVKEDYYDPSIVSDWDMSAGDTSAWTPDANATITRTEYISPTTGMRYLRLTCSTAPCEATQTVSDTIAASAYFTALYTAGDAAAGAIVGFQIRRSTDNAVMTDSGWLTSTQTAALRPDYKWDSAVALTAGDWVIALRCNSTTIACLFTDVRLVKNYLANGGFENGVSGWTGGCTQSSLQQVTGANSAHITGTNHCSQTPTLTVGDYYLLQGWVFNNGSAAETLAFGWGTLTGTGGTVDGLRATSQFWDNTRAVGEWEFIQTVIRADGSNDIARAIRTLGLSNVDAYLDDVALLHLRRNPQHRDDYFQNLHVDGAVNGAYTLDSPTIATGVAPDGSGFKHARISTGSLSASSDAAVTLTWSTPFADANYTVTCSVVEATAGTATLRLHHLESVAATGVTARIVNDDSGAAHTGTLHCTAVHD